MRCIALRAQFTIVECFDLFYHFHEFIGFSGDGIHFSLFFEENASRFRHAWAELNIFINASNRRKSKAINISQRWFTYCEWLERTVVICSSANDIAFLVSLEIFSLSVLCLAFAPIRSCSRAVQQRAHIFRRHSTQRQKAIRSDRHTTQGYIYSSWKNAIRPDLCVCYLSTSSLRLFVLCLAPETYVWNYDCTCSMFIRIRVCVCDLSRFFIVFCMLKVLQYDVFSFRFFFFFFFFSQPSLLCGVAEWKRAAKCFARTRRGQSECEMTNQRMDS